MATTVRNLPHTVQANGNEIRVWGNASLRAEQQAREVAAALPRNDDRINCVATGATNTEIWLQPPESGVTNLLGAAYRDGVVPDGYEAVEIGVTEDNMVTIEVERDR